MIVYHGSQNKIDKPIHKGSRRGTEFGSGFYCTENLLMAQTSCRLGHIQFINKYDLDTEGLNIKEYKLDLEWLLFVCHNRLGLDIENETKDIDIIIGPTADDKLYRTVQNFLDNTYSVDETLNILSCMKIDRQINIVSKKALNSLDFLGAIELTLKEIFNIKENEMINLSSINDKVFKARRNSNKDVYFIDLQENSYVEYIK